MKLLARFWQCISPVLIIALVCATLVIPTAPAFAGTTGTISGTVADSTTGAPIVGATVSATSPSGSATTTTNDKGFYILQQLIPDTYAVSVTAKGYQDVSFPGITVVQDLAVRQDANLSTQLATIAHVKANSAGSLVKGDTTSDTYVVSGAQLNAISGGNDLHKTLYQYIAAIPGITGSGFPAQPRVHGGSAADISYEFDGIPINEDMTGLFTTNLSNVGIGSILVSTGGLSAANGASGIGIINTIAKSGTYPGFADLTYTATPTYRNIYETLEYGSATKNQKFSWFFSLDNTNALNQYASGQTYPLLAVEQADGPGVVKTTDIIGNFHWRPTAKDDIQFLIQNGLGEFDFGYLMQRAPGEALPVTANVCPGATIVATAAGGPSYTGAEGGTAPNGATCPLGLYYGTASTQNGGGNYWHHYSGLGKLQWNHIINDHSSVTLTGSENFNQYIFDQPVVDANLPAYENNGTFDVGSCPLYPFVPGTPIQEATAGNPATRECDQQVHYFGADYEDRASRIYSLSGKYDNALNANDNIEIGAGDSYSDNLYQFYYLGWFNTPGTWPSSYPGLNFDASYPTRDAYVYAQGDFQVGKFLLSPGVRYSQRRYDYPVAGGATGSAIDPTFAFNYQADKNDVIIGSVSTSASLVASGYVYRYVPPGPLNGPLTTDTTLYYCSPFNTTTCGISPQPTRNHSYNLMWEHQIDPSTSFKFGPYVNEASNIFTDYVPLELSGTPPTYVAVPGTQGLFANDGIRKAFGLELGISHVDQRVNGISYWVSGTYDNFWTNTTSSLNTPYGTIELPPSTNGVLLRSSLDPPLSGTFTAQLNEGVMHFIPQLYLQSSSIFYTGTIDNTATGNVTAVPNHTTGWGIVNATLEFDAGRNKDLSIGIQGENILNYTKPVTPCTPTTYSASTNLGTGCAPYNPVGYGNMETGINAASGLQYPNYQQSIPLFFFFITKKF